MSGFNNILFEAAQGKARLKDSQQISPWNKFLGTLDSNPNISEDEVQTLFSKTLAQSSSDWKDSNDNTLLMHMASRGQNRIVKRLIHELYANVNAVNKDGTTALHMAARGGYMSVCSELLDSHADPCKKDQNGSTPAMIAQNYGHASVAEFLSKQETAKNLWLHGPNFFNRQK